MEKSAQFSEDQLKISGTGYLSIKNGADGVVCFNFAAVDGCAPTCGEVFGDRELLDQAWHASRATLAMFGKIMRVKIIGKIETTGAVIIHSDSVFRGLAQLATRMR